MLNEENTIVELESIELSEEAYNCCRVRLPLPSFKLALECVHKSGATW